MFCEDYPCCGHTPSDPCDPDGTTYADMWNMLNHEAYDHYYSQD